MLRSFKSNRSFFFCFSYLSGLSAVHITGKLYGDKMNGIRKLQ